MRLFQPFSLGVCCLIGIGAGTGAHAQVPAQEARSSRLPASRSADPGAGPEKTAQPGGQTLEDLIPVIDKLSVAELRARVNRVKNALDRDGQQVLLARARVTRIQESAVEQIKSSEKNPKISEAEQTLQDAATRKALEGLVRIRDPKQRQKDFSDFMEKRGLDVDTLGKLAAYRDAVAAREESAKILRDIDAVLSQPLIDPILVQIPGGSLSDQLKEISQAIANKRDKPRQPADRDLSSDALEKLIKALVR
jgi:hypothetical protein